MLLEAVSIDIGGAGDPGVAQPAALADGYAMGEALNPPNEDETAVLGKKDSDANTIDLFYVERITNGGGRATAYGKARNQSGDRALDNWVVFSGAFSGGAAPNMLAHELMHVLLNSPHRNDPPTALFRGGTTLSKDVSGTKRIGPYPDATAVGVGTDDVTTIRKNAESLP